MTEINWSFIITRLGTAAVLTTGALSTIDLSYPTRLFERLGQQYAPCLIMVKSSTGEIYEKSWT